MNTQLSLYLDNLDLWPIGLIFTVLIIFFLIINIFYKGKI